MNVASLGTLKERRALIESIRASDWLPVALDLFQLGRESEILSISGGRTLRELLYLSLVDYRCRYTDTRREHLIRRDLDKHRTDGHSNPMRTLVCLFCATPLAIRATTSQSYRIAQLMVDEPTDEDRDISAGYRKGFDIKLVADLNRALWCVADVRDAIRPHVGACALASLGCLQVPRRPDAVWSERRGMPLFGEP